MVSRQDKATVGGHVYSHEEPLDLRRFVPTVLLGQWGTAVSWVRLGVRNRTSLATQEEGVFVIQ